MDDHDDRRRSQHRTDGPAAAPVRVLSRRAILGGAALATVGGTMMSATHPASATPAATIPEPSDQEFFGVWDGQAWTTPPQLDYAGFSGLAPVAAAAKQGDYDQAGVALLSYARSRPKRAVPTYGTNGDYPDKRLPLIIDNIWSLGKGELYHSDLRFDRTTAAVSADVTEVVAGAGNGVGFLLMARIKSDALTTVAGRHAGSGAPVLTVTTSEGSVTIPPLASTYIAAGSEAGIAHGDEPQLLIRDSGTGPYGDQTRKAYLYFDLGKVSGRPTGATLQLTGSSTADDTELMLYQVNETFEESSRTWNNTIQNTLSYQGDPDGFDWTWPDHTDKEWYYQLPRFYFAGPMTDAYADSGDEKLAAALLRQINDFVDDADGYDSPAGAGSYPRDLDVAWRIQNWTYSYETLRRSPALDAATNTRILKTVFRSGEFLRTTDSTTPNHQTTTMGALLYVATCFAELAAVDGWIDDALASLDTVLTDSVRSDGGYAEATYSYSFVTVGDYLTVARWCKDNDIAFTPGDNLHKLAWYLADELLPNGFGPAYGDSTYADFTGQLRELADFFDDDQLRYVAALGKDGRRPDHNGALYPDTRVLVQRTGWQPPDWYLRMNADRGPHQHTDELAVIVYAHDRQLLPDVGCFSYADDPKSNFQRYSSDAHSTVTIDDGKQDPTAAGSVASVLQSRWVSIGSGSSDAISGVRHSRDAIMIGGGAADSEGFWLIVDTLSPQDNLPHNYRQNWQLLPGAKPTLNGVVADTAFGTGTELQIVPLLTKGLTAQLHQGYYSPAFYTVTDTTYVSHSRTATGTVRLAMLLLPVLPDQPRTAAVSLLSADDDHAIARLDLEGAGSTRATVGLAGASGRVHRSKAFAFDGVFGYHELRGQRERIVGREWTSIEAGGIRLAVDRPLSAAIEIDHAKGSVTIDTAERDRSTITMTIPAATSLTVNGERRQASTRGDRLEISLG